MLKHIAILGPESTGKSHLAQELAEEFKCYYVPEIARTYLKDIGLKYQYTDVLNIAKLQLLEEQKYIDMALRAKHKYLISDTEMITIKIWLEYYQWEVPKWIESAIVDSPYMHYLLTDIDLAWQYDPLRQNPNDRAYLKAQFIDQLMYYGKTFSLVTGVDNHRFINSIRIIKDI